MPRDLCILGSALAAGVRAGCAWGWPYHLAAHRRKLPTPTRPKPPPKSTPKPKPKPLPPSPPLPLPQDLGEHLVAALLHVEVGVAIAEDEGVHRLEKRHLAFGPLLILLGPVRVVVAVAVVGRWEDPNAGSKEVVRGDVAPAPFSLLVLTAPHEGIHERQRHEGGGQGREQGHPEGNPHAFAQVRRDLEREPGRRALEWGQGIRGCRPGGGYGVRLLGRGGGEGGSG